MHDEKQFLFKNICTNSSINTLPSNHPESNLMLKDGHFQFYYMAEKK